jgi:hypothetical protein
MIDFNEKVLLFFDDLKNNNSLDNLSKCAKIDRGKGVMIKQQLLKRNPSYVSLPAGIII